MSTAESGSELPTAMLTDEGNGSRRVCGILTVIGSTNLLPVSCQGAKLYT